MLIAATTWWPSGARLAMAFQACNARVSALCPIGHPLRALAQIDATYTYSAWHPLHSLTSAIHRAEPDYIVPMDDRTVEHLHALHGARTTSQALRTLIERSIGDPAGYDLSGSRYRLLEALRAIDVQTPIARQLNSVSDVRAWCGENAGPWVIKAEGSWGGAGVLVARTRTEAESAFLRLACPMSLRAAMRSLLLDRDLFAFSRFLTRDRPGVVGQAYVVGRQSNIMVACREGRVLGTIAAESVATQGPMGATTITKLVTSPEMDEAARVTASMLGLSGFFGLDFIVDPGSRQYSLIEMNPRATQIGHFEVNGRTLAQAFLAVCPTGRTTDDPGADMIAMFPQALRFTAPDAVLRLARLDVPWSEPDLVRELLRLPWSKRGWLSRFARRIRPNAADGQPIDQDVAAQILNRKGPYSPSFISLEQ